VFFGTAPRAGTGHVEAGATIGGVLGRGPEDVLIELWDSAQGGHRLANLWNPAVFLDVGQSASLVYPGDNAPPSAIAKWMGTTAQAAGLPAELPVMAALVESGLHNLNYGDRDDHGYFQMRVSIWNVGPYAGFPERPDLQMKWFVDHAKTVRSRQGRDRMGHPECYGEWAADVILPVEQYRGRYQLKLQQARQLLGRPQAPVGPSCARAAAPRPEGGVGAVGRGR
jgi:hypothetical protein